MKMDLSDLIMSASIEHYKKLPKSGKPNNNEWTVMSAIVGGFEDGGKRNLKVLSMGTGSKCIGRSFMSPKGDVLNDSHSEVIARRGFLRYLFKELISLYKNNYSEVFDLAPDSSYRVGVKKSVKFYFATSMSPCGDASIMPKTDDKSQPDGSLNVVSDDNVGSIIGKIPEMPEDEEPSRKRLKISDEEPKDIHRTGAKCLPKSEIQDRLLPGVDYHQTGAVRTKPGRGDPTASVSCSDKLARWNSMGIQGALLSYFVRHPVYLDMIVIGGCPYSRESCDRAINRRTGRARPVLINRSKEKFPDGKSDLRIHPSPKAMASLATAGKEVEVTVNGRKQGTTKKNIHKISSRSFLCKKELFILFGEIVEGLKEKGENVDEILPGLGKVREMRYIDAKSGALDYKKEWENVRDCYFKIWTEKPDNLLDFTVDED